MEASQRAKNNIFGFFGGELTRATGLLSFMAPWFVRKNVAKTRSLTIWLLISFGFGRHDRDRHRRPTSFWSAFGNETENRKNLSAAGSLWFPAGERQNTRFGGSKPIN